uniref:C3a anaphylatoxin chemotactic receptor-like n=1 Tax=Phallusia mammillata TaxID=59560 RepID=A0A6F9D7B8_9ASCI|nr:C3a anaphylatoxin chemotactic receptor-like [Phallusia mammillata]
MRSVIFFTILVLIARQVDLSYADGTTPSPIEPMQPKWPVGAKGQYVDYPIDLENVGDLDPEDFEHLQYEFEGALDYDGHDPEYDRAVLKPMNLTLGVIYAIITLVGLIANGIVFFVIFAGKEISKTVTAMYVLQLAIADSIFLLTLPIFATQKVAMNWSFGQSTCTLCHTAKFINYYAGIFFLTAMSVDRYVAVAYSTKSHQLRTHRRTKIICAIVWLAAAIMTLPVMMYARTEQVESLTLCRIMFPGYIMFNGNATLLYMEIPMNDTYDFYQDYLAGTATLPPDFTIPDNVFTCSHNNQSSIFPIWLIVNFVIGFLIPFIIISISYILIIKHLRVSENKIANMTGKKTVNMRKRVTRMVAMLVICFVICWLPYHIFNLSKIQGFHISTTACFGIEQFLVALGFSNSAINPLLYSFLGHNFRTRLSESIQVTRRRFRRSSSLAPGAGHFGGTHSHTDHANNSVKRKLSNLVSKRKMSRSDETGKNGSTGGSSPTHGRKHKFGIPLLEMKKRENNDNVYCANHTEGITRTQAQTETTRILHTEREPVSVREENTA